MAGFADQRDAPRREAARGLDAEGSEPCTALGEPATLVLWGDDYDGGYKAWVRWPDGRADIVTGPGPGRAPETRLFDAVSSELLGNVLAYTPSFTGGVFVAAAAPISRMVVDMPSNGATVPAAYAR